MNKELKPTWDYILNDLAFGNLLVKCLYSEYPDVQDKYDLQYQIKLKDKEIERLNNIIDELEKHLLDYLEEWEECKTDNEFVSGRCLMARDVLYDIHKLKEGKE